MIVVLVHGFNVDDPERTVGGVATHLAAMEYDVHSFCYGHAGFIDVRFANENIAHALLSQMRSIHRYHPDKEIVPVGHSNGCYLIQLAASLQRGVPVFKRCIYISPALGNKAELPPQIEHCDVMHTYQDSVVSLGSLIPFHKWGNMGKVGYRGDDTRYTNINCSKEVAGHSAWFTPESMDFTLGTLDDLLLRPQSSTTT